MPSVLFLFAYAIVKEMETAIYPWLKSYNIKKLQQSFENARFVKVKSDL